MIDWKEIEAEFACNHEEQKTVKFVKSNDLFAVVRQCTRCGHSSSQLKQSSYNLSTLPLRDDELDKQWQKKKEARRQELFIKHAASQTWLERYNTYLQTEHWQQLKHRVFTRDSFICQNCFRKLNSATAVCHHLDYRGLGETGHSFAFECVTLCDNCHVDRHPHLQGNGHAR